jgi:hypothetical protein
MDTSIWIVIYGIMAGIALTLIALFFRLISREDIPEFRKVERLKEAGFQIKYKKQPLSDEDLKQLVCAIGQSNDEDFTEQMLRLSSWLNTKRQ